MVLRLMSRVRRHDFGAEWTGSIGAVPPDSIEWDVDLLPPSLQRPSRGHSHPPDRGFAPRVRKPVRCGLIR